MKKLSFFKKLLQTISAPADKSQNSNLSAKDAASLQKNYIENLNKKSDLLTPPYVEIAKQLSNPKDEIFRAAVYYLVQIACNEPRYVSSINSILQQCRKKNKLSAENILFLDEQLKKLSVK